MLNFAQLCRLYLEKGLRGLSDQLNNIHLASTSGTPRPAENKGGTYDSDQSNLFDACLIYFELFLEHLIVSKVSDLSRG